MDFDPSLAGWVPPESRTDEQSEKHAAIMATIPSLQFYGTKTAMPDKVCHWDMWMKLYGKDFPCLYQRQGSCVGQGATGAISDSMVGEIIDGEREQWVMPYMPYFYALGRMESGINGRGDGSTGSGQAAALRKYGFFEYNLPGLPQPVDTSDTSWSWGAQIEMSESDGRRVDPKWIEIGKQHLLMETRKLTTLDIMQEAIAQKKGVTIASNWGGMMQPPVKEGVLLNRRSGVWNHQMRVRAYWIHPVLGRIWWIHNSWSADAHGKCPSGAPLGGFWVQDKDMQYIIDQGEAFAYVGVNGLVWKNAWQLG